MFVRAINGSGSGGGYTFVDETTPTNGDKTFTTQNACLFCTGTNTTYKTPFGITVNGGEVVDSHTNAYGSASYVNGIITIHSNGYTGHRITGYME